MQYTIKNSASIFILTKRASLSDARNISKKENIRHYSRNQ